MCLYVVLSCCSTTIWFIQLYVCGQASPGVCGYLWRVWIALVYVVHLWFILALPPVCLGRKNFWYMAGHGCDYFWLLDGTLVIVKSIDVVIMTDVFV